MPDFFVIDLTGKDIPARPELPTTLRHTSRAVVGLADPRDGSISSELSPGGTVTLTAPCRAHSLGANVMMTRS
jgi:hypothetical protein